MAEQLHQPVSTNQGELAVFAQEDLGWEAQNKVFSEVSVTARGLEEGTHDPAAGFSADDVRYFQSQQSPAEAAKIAFRKELLVGFEPFAADVERIKAESSEKSANEVEGYLASGNTSHVYAVSHQGKQFAIRIGKRGDNALQMDKYAAAMMRGRGIKGMEQMVGLSYEAAATVSELLPGKRIEEYSPGELAAIPDAHFSELAHALINAARAGIDVDCSGGNLLYDTEAGFGFIDYEESNSKGQGTAHAVTDAVFRTSRWLKGYGTVPPLEFKEDYEVLADVMEKLTPTYERWLGILETEIEAAGLPDDFFTHTDLLHDRLSELKAIDAQLHTEGEIDRLVDERAAWRKERVAAIETKVAKLDPKEDEAMITNSKQQLGRLRQPEREFPNGPYLELKS